MQQQNQISPARPLDAWAITDRTQSYPPAAKGTPLPPPHGARGIEIRKRNRRFAPTFQNATKCNVMQQDNRRSPARPLSALPITERTQSYPPAVNRNPGTKSKVRTNVPKCNQM